MSQRDWTKSIETISAHAHRRLEGQRLPQPVHDALGSFTRDRHHLLRGDTAPAQRPRAIDVRVGHAHRRLEGQLRLMPSTLRTTDTAFVPTNETERSRAKTRMPTSPSERKIGKVGISITIDMIMIPPNSSDLTTAMSDEFFLLIARDTCGKADPASKISH